MSYTWKCCDQCQCPCKNIDLCPDTASTLISHGSQNVPEFINRQTHEASHTKTTESLEDLRLLERRVNEKLKNITVPKFLEHPEEDPDLSSGVSDRNGQNLDFANLESNEILLLRRRLEEAEIRNHILEERVNRIAQMVITSDKIMRLKREIIVFIEDKFSTFLQNQQ